MSDTARDYQTIQTASTEGLDDLFVDVAEVQLHATAPQSDATASQLNATARSCTVKEASNLLGVPTSTIYRRIKAGKYPVIGNDETGSQIISVQLHATAPQLKTQLHAVAMQSDAVETQLHAVAVQSDHTESDISSVVALIDMSKKLEAANYRIGWLESQLLERAKEVEQRDTAIKLLTDSQHKPGWWARFKKWCAGT